jgi:hypothetical protein
MTLLHNGVPITLLCDLISAREPESAAINSAERPADDPIWLEAAITLGARHHAATA